MLSTIIFHIAENKSLLIAALISLLVHIFLLGGHSVLLPSDSNNRTSMNVQLQKAQLEKTAIKPNVRPAHATPAASKPTPPKAQASNKDETAEIEEPADPLYTENTHINQTNPTIPINTEATSTSLSNDLSANETINNTPTTEINSGTHTDINKPYTSVQTEFEVTRGDDLGTLGITQITFNMDAQKNTYQLSSITEAKGVAALFLNKLAQYSEGTINEKGLKPTYYAYEYGTNSNKNQYARLSWSEGLIELSSKKGTKSERLPEGTQDFLSFMYQFMFTPPLNTMQLTMTNGKYLRTYVYSFEGEETITTKLGEIKTIHLLKSGDSQEKTEIWLATDYRNIPVKIRKTEKNGEVIEQVATMIKTGSTD